MRQSPLEIKMKILVILHKERAVIRATPLYMKVGTVNWIQFDVFMKDLLKHGFVRAYRQKTRRQTRSLYELTQKGEKAVQRWLEIHRAFGIRLMRP
jgi:predicted transcriptional regulator